MRTALPVVTLISGLVLGSAFTTWLWQGPMERRARLIQEVQEQVEAVIPIAERTRQSLNECTAALQKYVGRANQ